MAATWGWDEAFQQRRFAQSFKPADIQVIIVDKQDIGWLAIHFSKSKIELNGIYLLPDFQRLGFGSSIIKGLIHEGKFSSRPVNLQVLKINPARALYERLGFEVTDENQTHFIMRIQP